MARGEDWVLIFDRKQIPWVIFFVLALVGSSVYYVYYARHAVNGPSGRTWQGLTYGGLGSAMILFAAAIGLRKKRPTWRIGRAEAWLRAHLWLGLLSGPMILFHSGFLVGGALTLTLWALLILVLVTGVIGLFIQQVVPKLMTQRVQAETIYEQLDHMIDRLRRDADALVSAKCGPLNGDGEGGAAVEQPAGKKAKGRGKVAEPVVEIPKDSLDRLRNFYVGQVQPFLRTGRALRGGEFGSADRANVVFTRVRAQLVPELHGTLLTLQDLCDERRQMELQRRLHLILHGWILIHAPLSWALVILSTVHAIWTLRY